MCAIYYPISKAAEAIRIKYQAKAHATGTIMPDTRSFFDYNKQEIAREVYKDQAIAGFVIFDQPNTHDKIQNYAILKKRERLQRKRERLIT